MGEKMSDRPLTLRQAEEIGAAAAARYDTSEAVDVLALSYCLAVGLLSVEHGYEDGDCEFTNDCVTCDFLRAVKEQSK